MKSTTSLFKDQSVDSATDSSEILAQNSSFRETLKRWALTTIIIPTLGFILAIQQLLFFHIGFVEIGLLVGMYTLTIIGVELGFHRLFAHHAFQVHDVFRAAFAILGSMAAQGPPIYWVSNHRCHHQYSDRPGDPHSPHIQEEDQSSPKAMWHAHIGWLITNDIPNSILYAKDLLRDPIVSKINQMYLLWVILGLIIPGILGGLLTWTWFGAFQGFLWGGLVRMFLVHHVVWGVNSFSHVYGNRPFKTEDYSTNNIWLAIPSLGGAWHNNHHAFPTSAINGLQWWQLDLGGGIVWLLEKLKLAWNVNRPSEKIMEAKRQ
jgi:stearoyl-CoA desaturase (Delta-9 desaturase)